MLFWHVVRLAWILRVAVAVYVFVIVTALFYLDLGEGIKKNLESIISTCFYCYWIMQTWDCHLCCGCHSCCRVALGAEDIVGKLIFVLLFF